MSDIMRPIPFSQLMNWIIEEHKTQDAIFGVRKMVTTNQEGALPIFDERIETPFGPAAGPNTQLAQNIVASYVAGSRFFELKTVQVMDGEELSNCVNKPCIVAQDECYNCEWSTELEVPQAFAEYVKAWFACHLIAREYGLGSPDGFVFNMSVGYDLEGIKSPKADAYIEGMKDASGSDVWNECRTWALANLDKFEHVDAAFVESIPARVSNSITESTLHGCPPAEIERIATYLITEKGLNTYIKCNPTLLGYEFARQRLNELGFDYIVFDDTHFREDLQWADAVPMFERLIALCAERGLEFGVKLTNTFPVDVTRNELPSTEMYMSGRSLFSLTIEAARRIAEQFDGKLRISYSGGATVYNIRALYDAGIWPVTLATDVLKPGGYERFSQMAGEFTDLDGKPFAGVSLEAVTAIQTDSLTNPLYKKPLRPLPDRKVAGKSPLSDCFTTPCRTSCPIQQDIPAYLAAVDEGRYEDALNIIIERNALPFITGTICPHPCGRSCERAFYEPEGAQIRTSKLKAAREAMTAVLPKLRAQAIANDGERNVAVIGGGPAGLATAFFLTRAGVPVTIFEARDSLGGVVRHVIPEFRIASDDISHDAELCLAFGAKVQLNARVDSIDELKAQGFTDVVVATGAVLTCDVMELGEPDASGRRSLVATGETVELPAATVICAVGEGIDASLYDAAGVEHDRRGRLAATSTGVEGVWAAGDCRRGPATVVEAIADAAEVARAIAGVDFNRYVDCNERAGREDTCYERKGSLCRDKRNCTKTRCLGCGSVCEVCCDVCPNRANVAIKVPGLDKHQVVHVDGMCNECGNCAVFCPYQEGRPYKDKLTLFWSEEDMENSENEGFLAVDDDHFKVRVAGTVRTVSVDAVNTGLPEAVRLTIRAVRDNYSYLLKK